MQSDHNEIYKKAAAKTGKSEEIYKSIGSLVFKNLAGNLKRPKKLIIKLKGVGYWYLRKNRITHVVEAFPPNFDKRPPEDDLGINLLKYENRIEVYNIFKERIKDYDVYVQQKSEIRKKRNETQQIITPTEES